MRAVWLVAAMLLLAACEADSAGSTVSPPPIQPASSAPATLTRVTSPPPMSTPPAPPTLSGTRSLYEFHAGATVLLHVGESVRVALGADYVVPLVEGDAVTRAAAEGGYPTGRDVEATFTAVVLGRAELVSQTDYGCRHVEPKCLRPQWIWQVHVVVA